MYKKVSAAPLQILRSEPAALHLLWSASLLQGSDALVSQAYFSPVQHAVHASSASTAAW